MGQFPASSEGSWQDKKPFRNCHSAAHSTCFCEMPGVQTSRRQAHLPRLQHLTLFGAVLAGRSDRAKTPEHPSGHLSSTRHCTDRASQGVGESAPGPRLLTAHAVFPRRFPAPQITMMTVAEGTALQDSSTWGMGACEGPGA